jgi:hypothetical protein
VTYDTKAAIAAIGVPTGTKKSALKSLANMASLVRRASAAGVALVDGAGKVRPAGRVEKDCQATSEASEATSEASEATSEASEAPTEEEKPDGLFGLTHRDMVVLHAQVIVDLESELSAALARIDTLEKAAPKRAAKRAA